MAYSACVTIDKELWTKFKAKCKANRYTCSSQFSKLIKEYVEAKDDN